MGALKSHGKIMPIDDERAVIGSLALTPLSLDFRREVAIEVTDPSSRFRYPVPVPFIGVTAAPGRVPATAAGGASC